MTLHDTVELSKKVLIWFSGAIAGIIVIVLLFQLGIIIKNVLFPPKVQPPTFTYGKLPQIRFPENAVTQKFTFTLNTLSGTLPELPNRLNVFQITEAQPNFLNL